MTLKITDETRKVGALKVDPKNARRHNEQQIAQIMGSIEEFGYVNKINIRPNNQIIGGHATLDALKRLGKTDDDDVEVRVVEGLTEAQYAKLAIALNKIPENSSWDYPVLADILGELKEGGDPLENIGMSESELDRILANDKPIEVKEVETGKVDDEFWISIRGPLASQAKALHALTEAMKPFAGVTVDLGTIAVTTE